MLRMIQFIVFIVLLISCEESKQKEQVVFDQPNILWLVCEDQSPQWFPFYGDSSVYLPNLERLASEGIVYDRAFAPVPVCSPARSSIITGMYPTTLGTHNMRAYNTYRNGENEPSLGIPSYSAPLPNGVRPFTEYLRAKGYYCTNNAKEDYNFKPIEGMWDESSEKAHWRNRKEGQPFFSVFNFNNTHEYTLWVSSKDSLFVDPSEIEVPPYMPDHPQIRHDLAVNYSNLARMDQLAGNILKELEDDGLLENTVIMFYGDHGGPFPRHKRSLYETGTQVPMVVRLPGAQKANTREDEMISFIDLAPTILSIADINIPEEIQGSAFLGKQKRTSEVEYVFSTSDRFDEIYDQKRAVRDSKMKYIRNTYPELPYAIPVAFRLNVPMMKTWLTLKEEKSLSENAGLWMADQKPKEELYNLEVDPYELNNLAQDPQHSDDLQRLSSRLDAWIEETNDLGQISEKELLKRWGMLEE